jgi:tetratricopeptide (TPR) repeat protein
MHYGNFKMNAKQPEKGIKYFRRVVELQPSNFTAKLNLATCLQKVGKKSQAAMELIHQVLEEDKMNYKALCVQGLLNLHSFREIEKAADNFTKSLFYSNSKYVPALLGMSSLLFENSHSEKALKYL